MPQCPIAGDVTALMYHRQNVTTVISTAVNGTSLTMALAVIISTSTPQLRAGSAFRIRVNSTSVQLDTCTSKGEGKEGRGGEGLNPTLLLFAGAATG